MPDTSQYLTKDDALTGAWKIIVGLLGLVQMLVIFSLLRLRDDIDENINAVKDLEGKAAVIEERIRSQEKTEL